MNEPANFFDGTANGCPESNLENPPLLPAVFGNKLCTNTVCMTAKHATGTHYDLHNLYGIAEADVTRQCVKNSSLKTKSLFLFQSGWKHFGQKNIPYFTSVVCGFRTVFRALGRRQQRLLVRHGFFHRWCVINNVPLSLNFQNSRAFDV